MMMDLGSEQDTSPVHREVSPVFDLWNNIELPFHVDYQLQRSSPWLSVSLRWQTWLVLLLALGLLGLVPYVVHRMMTAFTSPPPPGTFKVAAASFGFLTEVLLIKCLFSYLSSQHLQAVQSSFTLRPRILKEDESCYD